jgi:hypothetical protein
MSTRRFGIEFLIILVLILVAAGIWWWKDSETDQAVAEAQTSCQQEVAALTEQGERWAQALAVSEAHAAFRGFAAGVYPLVLRGGADTLDQAIGALLELPGVTFVHVLAPDGAVLASSDRKLVTTGQVGEDGTWVLTASEVVEREGSTPGTREMAAPVLGGAGPAAHLWMGYDVQSVLTQARPAGWPAGGDADRGTLIHETTDGSGPQPEAEAEPGAPPPEG